MQKRAQVSLFLLFGVIVLIGAGFLIYVNSSATESKSRETRDNVVEAPADARSVNPFVEGCIRSTLTDGVSFVAFQGGYQSVPEPFATLSGLTIPFYWYENSRSVPSKEVVEQQLVEYLKVMLPYCTQGFAAFEQLGYGIQTGPIQATVSLSAKNALADVVYPITLTKDASSFHVEIFQGSTETSLLTFLDSSAGIISQIEKKPDFVPLSYIVEMGSQVGFVAEILHEDNGTVIFSLMANNSPVPPAIFDFAVKYDWESESGKGVEIATIPKLNATTTYPFSYQVTATGEDLKFFDYTKMFDINQSTGWIIFTPSISDQGMHRILLKVQDSQGDEDRAFMSINVTSWTEPPEIENIPDQSVKAGSVFTFQVNAEDPDNDPLFYFVESDLNNLMIGPQSGTLSLTPMQTQIGKHAIEVTVVDIYGAAATEVFTLEVMAP